MWENRCTQKNHHTWRKKKCTRKCRLRCGKCFESKSGVFTIGNIFQMVRDFYSQPLSRDEVNGLIERTKSGMVSQFSNNRGGTLSITDLDIENELIQKYGRGSFDLFNGPAKSTFLTKFVITDLRGDQGITIWPIL